MSKWHPCYDKAESRQHLRDLRLAHASAEETPYGTPVPREELERMQANVASWFAHWPTAKQLRFLCDLPADEAASMLERMDAQLRDHLTSLLSSEVRDALDTYWGERTESRHRVRGAPVSLRTRLHRGRHHKGTSPPDGRPGSHPKRRRSDGDWCRHE